MNWVKIRYNEYFVKDEKHYKGTDERTLKGQSLGYHLAREGFTIIWAGDKTFAVPSQNVISLEMEGQKA